MTLCFMDYIYDSDYIKVSPVLYITTAVRLFWYRLDGTYDVLSNGSGVIGGHRNWLKPIGVELNVVFECQSPWDKPKSK